MSRNLNVLIIGGGAAGMAAAVFCAEKGCSVQLLEKNEKLGKKVYITGKGRCNFTNACDPEVFPSHIISNPRFLYSAFSRFNNRDAILFFERLGLKIKIERGERAFPSSDHASDVIRVLEKKIRELGGRISLNTEVESLIIQQPDGIRSAEADSKDHGKPAAAERPRVTGVRLKNGGVINADAVLIATGGLSYPSTGSTGDGYRFASEAGMSVNPCRPSLVPLITEESDIPELQGLSLKNVTLSFAYGKKGKKEYSSFGEMLFTHSGISGPLVLSASALAGKDLEDHPIHMHIDLKPALDHEQLDARLLREFDAAPNKALKNVIASVLPAKMRPVIVRRSKIDPEKPVNSVTKEERGRLVSEIKRFGVTAIRTGDYREAVITQGGVRVKEVDPKTMESKKVKGLFFAGEVLDLDALTGGFNLQIAWTTAFAAAEGIAGTGYHGSM